MSDDHPKPIENLLREWARKRREAAGDGLALESHRRAQLQEEVARAYAAPEASTAAAVSWWRLLWPRLVLAGTLGVLFVVALVQFNPGSGKTKSYDLARAERVEDLVQAPSPGAEAPVERFVSAGEDQPAAGGAVASVALHSTTPREQGPAPTDSVPAEAVPATPPPAAAVPTAVTRQSAALAPAPRTVTESPGDTADLLRRRYGISTGKSGESGLAPTTAIRSPSVAAPPPDAVVSMPEPSVALAESAVRSSAASREAGFPAGLGAAATSEIQYANTQRFSQVRRPRPNLNSPALPPVLQSFRLEQQGDRLRIVDADGSVYEGRLEVPPMPAEPEEAKADSAEVTARQEVPTVVTYGMRGDLRDARLRGAVQQPGVPAPEGQALLLENAFRVTGTNRTSRLPVVFEGVLTGDPAQASQRTAVASQALPAGAPPPLVQLPAGRLRGQLQLGSNLRLQIDAVPVSP